MPGNQQDPLILDPGSGSYSIFRFEQNLKPIFCCPYSYNLECKQILTFISDICFVLLFSGLSLLKSGHKGFSGYYKWIVSDQHLNKTSCFSEATWDAYSKISEGICWNSSSKNSSIHCGTCFLLCSQCTHTIQSHKSSNDVFTTVLAKWQRQINSRSGSVGGNLCRHRAIMQMLPTVNQPVW